MTKEEYWGKVYGLLVEYGASTDEHRRAQFVRYMSAERLSPHEYRFGGMFGFGGKCRTGPRGTTVDYYHEDHTPKLDALCAELNLRIAALEVPS